ncbi:MAG: hypothetical protein ACRCUE_19540 [Bosea sp. (in: a-proteobacteria)]
MIWLLIIALFVVLGFTLMMALALSKSPENDGADETGTKKKDKGGGDGGPYFFGGGDSGNGGSDGGGGGGGGD